ncbi:MAG: Aspartyl protease [Thermoanaerobaculia bacterium]|nr:Aspartyl protease [Thermoanaerobaculia bacterium]
MPTFTSTVADLLATGPGLQISVGPSRELINALTPLGARVASPQLVTALIDTGAHSTVLNPDVVSRLGIRPVGVAAIVTPSTTAALICNRYHINVYFSEDFVVENVFAIEAPMGGVPYQCLIGRDILRRATLIYSGRQNQFTLEF